MIQSKHNNKENLFFYSFLGMLAVISSYVTKDINMIRQLVFIKNLAESGQDRRNHLNKIRQEQYIS
jgi:hypothetical protein